MYYSVQTDSFLDGPQVNGTIEFGRIKYAS